MIPGLLFLHPFIQIIHLTFSHVPQKSIKCNSSTNTHNHTQIHTKSLPSLYHYEDHCLFTEPPSSCYLLYPWGYQQEVLATKQDQFLLFTFLPRRHRRRRRRCRARRRRSHRAVISSCQMTMTSHGGKHDDVFIRWRRWSSTLLLHRKNDGSERC